MMAKYICVTTQALSTMGKPFINLPHGRASRFLHPENPELILSMVASGFVFTFWNAINIRPSLLTDPSYKDQRGGIERNMNISLLIILAMAGGVAAIYKKPGYIPSLLMAATGAGMYIWTSAELNHVDTGSGTVLSQEPSISQSDAARMRSSSVLYADALQTNRYNTTSLPLKKRKEHSM
jgi:hypothetical protein